MNDYTKKVIKIIKSIPKGKTMSYGDIAKSAGKNRGAREVSRILHSCSEKYELPWHRVINSQGKISLTGEAGQFQREMLEYEGVRFEKNGKINEIYIKKGKEKNADKKRKRKGL
jgi:methylated-DNA-protein-cysteine methyltransferase-like protein